MSEFYKIWIEQCEPEEGVIEQFGVKKAA